jgi:hypothetical protein
MFGTASEIPEHAPKNTRTSPEEAMVKVERNFDLTYVAKPESCRSLPVLCWSLF